MNINFILFLMDACLFLTNFISNDKQTNKYWNSIQKLWFSVLVLFYLTSVHVILMSGDIHTNPGPTNFNNEFFMFCHWNLNSIPAHNYIRISQLEAYTAQHNLDVIALTESALRPTDQCDKIKIPGLCEEICQQGPPWRCNDI